MARRSEQALVSDQAPAGLDPSGFDPSRGLTAIVCAYCGNRALKATGSVNRSLRKGAHIYCNRECAGKDRRIFKTKAQKMAEKAAYDAEYRRKNLARLKAEKAAWYQRTADREREREYRKRTMPRHVEYCRRPEYKAWKREYDRRYRAAEYGPFADAFLVLQDLEAEIAQRASRYEIYTENGLINKSVRRKREYEQVVSG